MTRRDGRLPEPVAAGRGDAGGDAASGLPFDPRGWLVAYRTLRNMKPVQVAGIAERRLRHAVVPRLPVDFDARYERRVPADLAVSPEPLRANRSTLAGSLSAAERDRYRAAAAAAADGRYTFLDRTIDFGDRIDWTHPAIDAEPLFWRLKLEAFEGFEWLVLSGASPSAVEGVRSSLERQALRWGAANPIGEGRYLRRSWIPHSVSLRVLHWCRYVAWCAGGDVAVPDRLLELVYKNALFLDAHVEHDVGGNHLVENAVALLAAGTLFDAHDTGWTERARRLFEAAADEQFLADGCHFERSPMYHVTVLRRYATAYDLLSSLGLPTGVVRSTAEAAMGFLARLIRPGGRIPLLNDAVHGEAIEATSCLSYCRACGLTRTDPPKDPSEGSGYRLLPTAAGTMLFDVGDVGPPHLPAHSHNDHLSVLLRVDGRPVLADTGVYDYGANRRRRYARSVAAHNTAQYGSAEPIPIGGSYLLGRRTRVSVVADEPGCITARYARRGVGPAYEHRRTVATTGPGWEVVDDVSADGDGRYTVRYHFHPGVDVAGAAAAEGGFDVALDGDRIARVRVHGGDRCGLARSPYFPAYGREEFRPVVVASAPVGRTIRTTLEPVDGE